VGHLHYFTKETALATLQDTGYEIQDYFFTARPTQAGGGLKQHLAQLPRRLLGCMNAALAAKLLGGFSLLVLAEARPESAHAVSCSAPGRRPYQTARAASISSSAMP
jgi:hypothetical protein